MVLNLLLFRFRVQSVNLEQKKVIWSDSEQFRAKKQPSRSIHAQYTPIVMAMVINPHLVGQASTPTSILVDFFEGWASSDLRHNPHLIYGCKLPHWSINLSDYKSAITRVLWGFFPIFSLINLGDCSSEKHQCRAQGNFR